MATAKVIYNSARPLLSTIHTECAYCSTMTMAHHVELLYEDDQSNVTVDRTKCMITASRMPYINGSNTFFKSVEASIWEQLMLLSGPIVPPFSMKPPNAAIAQKMAISKGHMERGTKHELSAIERYNELSGHKVIPCYLGKDAKQRTFTMQLTEFAHLAKCFIPSNNEGNENMERDAHAAVDDMLELMEMYFPTSSHNVMPCIGATPDGMTYCGLPVEVKCPNIKPKANLIPSYFTRYKDQVAVQNIITSCLTSHFVQFDASNRNLLISEVDVDVGKWIWDDAHGSNFHAILDTVSSVCGPLENNFFSIDKGILVYIICCYHFLFLHDFRL